MNGWSMKIIIKKTLYFNSGVKNTISLFSQKRFYFHLGYKLRMLIWILNFSFSSIFNFSAWKYFEGTMPLALGICQRFFKAKELNAYCLWVKLLYSIHIKYFLLIWRHYAISRWIWFMQRYTISNHTCIVYTYVCDCL